MTTFPLRYGHNDPRDHRRTEIDGPPDDRLPPLRAPRREQG